MRPLRILNKLTFEPRREPGRRRIPWRPLGRTLALLAALAALQPAPAAAATGKLYALGGTAPSGSVWIGTHLWVSDRALGFCRLDDLGQDGALAINESTCSTDATWPGQPTYDPPPADGSDWRHFVYVPDSWPGSQGVWRLELDPVSETVTDAVLMAPGRALAIPGATATALGPDGELFVGSSLSGTIVRIIGRRLHPLEQRLQAVGKTSDGAGIAGLVHVGSTLYLAERSAVTKLGPVGNCTGRCTAAATPIVSSGRPTALVGGPGGLILADTDESGGATRVLRYRVDGTAAPVVYATAAVDGTLFTRVWGLAHDAAGNLFVGDDAGDGVQETRARIWRVGAGQPPVADSPPRPSLWQGAGVFVEVAGDVPVTLLAEQLRANGFRWVAVMTHHGTETRNEDTLANGWLKNFRAAGLRVGSWGYNQQQPEEEAALAAELVQRFGLEFHIANAEIEYKCSGDDGLCSGDIPAAAERFGRSARFARTFRELLPDLPGAVSTYGRVDMANLDWAAWRAGRFELLCQAYLNEREMDDPVLCAEGAMHEHWDLSEVHPTIGAYQGQAGRVAVEEYVARLRGAGVLGFSVYLSHHLTDEQYATFGEAIARLRIAR